MLIVGQTTATGATAANATANRVYSSAFAVPKACMLTKLTAYTDGAGATNDTQTVKGVVYDADGALVGSTPETIITTETEGWIDLIFDTPLSLTAQAYEFGLHYGTTSQATRYYKISDGTNLATTTDTYSDGPAATISPSHSSGQLVIYGTYFYAWTAPNEDDEFLAKYAFSTAQDILGNTPPDPRTKVTAQAAWHGTMLDPQPQGASLAIVQANGTLTDYVGDRVRISAGGKSVVAYIHRETDLDLPDDTQISLSRRLWQGLAPLAVDSLLVTVEQLGPED